MFSKLYIKSTLFKVIIVHFFYETQLTTNNTFEKKNNNNKRATWSLQTVGTKCWVGRWAHISINPRTYLSLPTTYPLIHTKMIKIKLKKRSENNNRCRKSRNIYFSYFRDLLWNDKFALECVLLIIWQLKILHGSIFFN